MTAHPEVQDPSNAPLASVTEPEVPGDDLADNTAPAAAADDEDAAARQPAASTDDAHLDEATSRPAAAVDGARDEAAARSPHRSRHVGFSFARASKQAPLSTYAGVAREEPGASRVVDWQAMRALLPVGASAGAVSRRDRLWHEVRRLAPSSLHARRGEHTPRVGAQVGHEDRRAPDSMPLADVDLLVASVLGASLHSTRSVVRRAFKALRAHSAEADFLEAERVEKAELGTLFEYMAAYYELFAMFRRNDTAHGQELEFAGANGALCPPRAQTIIHSHPRRVAVQTSSATCQRWPPGAPRCRNGVRGVQRTLCLTVHELSPLLSQKGVLTKPNKKPGSEHPRQSYDDPLLCYCGSKPPTAKTAWFLRSHTPGRDEVSADTFVHVTTRTGLTVTTGNARAMRPSSRSSGLGGLVPELADALRAAAKEYAVNQKSQLQYQGRSKYLKYKDALPADVDEFALERHRRAVYLVSSQRPA
ncbi:hypothetical protein AB1Y20_012619 [Prymnesium parvum]